MRLDRIKGVVPTNGQWRHEGLDYIKVHLHFSRGMIKAYEPRQGDISDEVTENTRKVVRHVYSPFWLTREVLRYAGDCVVVSPENLRALVREKLKSLCRDYDLEIPS